MKQYYRTIAETEFGKEPNIKIREELAEQFLIRQYLGEQGGYFVEVGANESRRSILATSLQGHRGQGDHLPW